MRDEVACKNDIKTLIKQIIREEMETFKQELEEVKRHIQGTSGMAGSEQRNYSEAVKEKKKESILIVKPKKEQESETTKKLVKKIRYKKSSGRNNKIKKRR